MAKKSRKKTKTSKPDKKVIKILEHDGFSVGEHVWAVYLNTSIISGEIDEFYLKDSHGPAVSIMTQDKGYRTVLASTLSRTKLKKSDINNLKS